MKRKQILITAASINAVLLFILFISGLGKEPSPSNGTPRKITEIAPLVLNPQEEKVKIAQEEREKPSVEKIEPKIDFAKELEAITRVTNQKQSPRSPPSETVQQKEHLKIKVKKGDVLEKIARVHETTVSEIMELNQIKSTVLQIGQVLKIPNRTERGIRKKYYTVKHGDNPWTIAVKNQIKVGELLMLNDLNEEKARRLRPGDRLRIQ